jgi:hypothetical protein
MRLPCICGRTDIQTGSPETALPIIVTRIEFQSAARRVSIFGNSLAMLTLALLIVAFGVSRDLLEPRVQALGQAIREEVQNEAMTGLLAGLLIGMILVPILLLPVLPILWVDKMLGVKCPHCGRSLTLRCAHSEVIETGYCTLCKSPVFEPTDR